MRDFRDAKAMAHSLRDALNARAMEITHSESLELIAKTFGYENWNILSAKIDVAQPRSGEAVTSRGLPSGCLPIRANASPTTCALISRCRASAMWA